MTKTVELTVAQVTLIELVESLAAGDEITIVRDQRPVAKLVGEQEKHRNPRVPGLGKGQITLLIEDDEHLKGFEEYMS